MVVRDGAALVLVWNPDVTAEIRTAAVFFWINDPGRARILYLDRDLQIYEKAGLLPGEWLKRIEITEYSLEAYRFICSALLRLERAVNPKEEA